MTSPQILLCQFSIRYDGLQESFVPLLNKRHRISIVVYIKHQYLLVRIFGLVRMCHDIKYVAVLDMHDHLLERNPASFFQNRVFLRVPVVSDHRTILSQCVPDGNIFFIWIERQHQAKNNTRSRGLVFSLHAFVLSRLSSGTVSVEFLCSSRGRSQIRVTANSGRGGRDDMYQL